MCFHPVGQASLISLEDVFFKAEEECYLSVARCLASQLPQLF